MSRTYTTGEVATLCGVEPYCVRKWNRRGDLPSGPKPGRSGAGRGHELEWSKAAMEEAVARSKEQRGHGYRREPTPPAIEQGQHQEEQP